jgi:serine/threonine protein kinase
MMYLTKQDFDDVVSSMESFGQEIQQSMQAHQKIRTNRDRLRKAESIASDALAKRRSSFTKEQRRSKKSVHGGGGGRAFNSVLITQKVVNNRGNKGQKQINHYNILSSLGSGSYGQVKLCQNQMDMQFYAMKMVPVNRESKRRQSQESLGAAKKMAPYEALLTEVEVMQRLGGHPNIVELHEVMDDPDMGTLFLVLEYVSGGTLADYDAGETPAAREIFHDMLKGVGFMHHLNIIHRDLKPENFLVAADGVIKIADFGSAMKVPLITAILHVH